MLLREFNKENALKDLKLIKHVFDKLGIRFSLAYGTCLGAVREKDFIDTDDDIDLAVTDNLSLRQRKKIGTELMDLGFIAQDMFWIIFGQKEQNEPYYQGTQKTGILVIQRYVKTTIFFFYDDGKEMVCIPRTGTKPLISAPNKFHKKLEEIQFKGDVYLVPSPVKDYLANIYTNWKKPSNEHGKLYYLTHPKKETLKNS